MIKNGILHVHTQHSIKDSTLTIRELCERAVELGAPAIALTDHGVLTGVDEFMNTCKEKGLKGIPGLEAYVAEENEKRLHLILLPMDIIGYHAIVNALIDANKRAKKVGTLLFAEMNQEILNNHFGIHSKGHGHVIATSACIGGVLAGLNYINENYKTDANELNEIINDVENVRHAIKINQDSINELKERLKEIDKIAKTSFKKKEKELEKAAGSEYYKTLKEELAKEKEAASKASALASSIRFEINAKNKKITEFNKRNIDSEKYQKMTKHLEKANQNALSKEALLEKMTKEAIRYRNIFGNGNFYIEVQNHFIPEETEFMYLLDKIAQKLDIPTVAANDVHMSTKEDFLAREIVSSTRFHKYEKLREADKELYIKTDEELMMSLSSILGNNRANAAIENIGSLLERCNVVFPSEKHYPVFDKNKDSNELIRELSFAGIANRYTDAEWTEEKQKRMEYELNIICSMGYSDYHLIVQDFIGFGRKLGFMPIERYKYLEQNIRNMDYEDVIQYVESDQSEVGYTVGPGRGSAAGSLVCYLLGITDIDPTLYGLLFERFLNPERISMPDIDTDFGNGYREVVIEYIYKKYGKNSVCRIMTKGTYAARGAIKEVAKLLGTLPNNDAVEYEELGIRLAKVIPVKQNEKIKYHIEEFEEISKKENARTMEIINKAMLIEGCFVQYGMHAAGVVISDNDNVSDYVPLMWDDKNEQWKSQCDMNQVEENGLLKMDFLGLKNLNIITDCLREIKRTTGKSLNINEDVKIEKSVISAIIATGQTNSIFQLESGGFKNMLNQLNPDSFEDIILALAAYRPGPMDSIPQMIAVKHGRMPLVFACEQLKSILSLTYGCIIYQEQVQEIFKSLAGYSLGQADIVRRAMSKKKESVLLAEKASFIYGDATRNIHGCIANGIEEEVADKLFCDMVDFAKYAFNKSHAAAYAMISYITAWLKHYYPIQYMCISLEYTNIEKVTRLVEECKKMGIKILPFDINKSKDSFYSEESTIYFGITSIKGINEVDFLLKERNKNGRFKSFSDFVLRTGADKTIVEGLINVGAFDNFCKNRKALIVTFEMMSKTIKERKDVIKKINICNNQIEVIKKYGNCEEKILREKLNEIKKVNINIPTLEKIQISAVAYQKKRDELELSINQTTVPVAILEDELEKLELEKELVGIYITGHPLDSYDMPQNVTAICDLNTSAKHTIYGIVGNFKIVQTKKTKEDMAFFEIEDKTGILQIVCFPKKFKECAPKLHNGAIVTLTGKIVEEAIESFKGQNQEGFDENASGDAEIEVVQKMFLDNVVPLFKKRKELVLEISSIMDWNDFFRDEISPYIQGSYMDSTKEGCRLILHDKLFNELRTTNLIVSALLCKKYNCFVA